MYVSFMSFLGKIIKFIFRGGGRKLVKLLKTKMDSCATNLVPKIKGSTYKVNSTYKYLSKSLKSVLINNKSFIEH